MTIPPQAATAALSLVTGLLKLSGRVDRIMAEQASLRSDLALPGHPMFVPPMAVDMKRRLKKLLQQPEPGDPDPTDADRDAIKTLVAKANPPEDQLLEWMQVYLPEEVTFEMQDPTGAFVEQLHSRRDTWDFSDADIARVAAHLQPGEDHRRQTLPWQLATAVVNVAAELAVENQSLVIRNDRARPIIAAILERFADPDFTVVGSSGALLIHVLRATLNAAVDNREALNGDKAWLESVLRSLADARDASGEGDDYVVGLVTGSGYNLLVAELLEEGATRLSTEDADVFESIVADVLVEASKAVTDDRDFDQFFQNHWSDIVQAGLRSLHDHGSAILADESPLLRGTLLAVVNSLAEADDRSLVSGDVLVAAVQAAVEVVATKPELLEQVGQPWLQDLLGSIATVASDRGIREVVSQQGLDALLRASLDVVARHPELLVKQPGLLKDVVGHLLGELANAGNLRVETLAAVGARAILEQIAENPSLIDSQYSVVVAQVAGILAQAADGEQLTADHAAQLLAVAIEAIARNPQFLIDTADGKIPPAVVSLVLKATSELDLSHTAVTKIVRGVLDLLAGRGGGLMDDDGADGLERRLEVVLAAALARAAAELGKRLDLPSLPAAVVGLTEAWARGEVPTLDPNDPVFIELFGDIAERALERAA